MRKSLQILAAAIMISILTLTACAAPAPPIQSNNLVSDTLAVDIPFANFNESFLGDFSSKSEFAAYHGTVLEVRPFYEFTEEGETIVNGKFFVLVEGNRPEQLYERVEFIVSDDTFIISDIELKEGMSVSAFYDFTRPTVKTYPPQLYARVLAVPYVQTSDGLKPTVTSFTVDRFSFTSNDRVGEGFINLDGSLQLRLDVSAQTTEITFEDGTPFEGELSELTNRAFVVLSYFRLTSVPAHIFPASIIVLFERAVHPTHAFGTLAR